MQVSGTATPNMQTKARKPFVLPEVVQHKSLTDGTLMLVSNVQCWNNLSDPAARCK